MVFALASLPAISEADGASTVSIPQSLYEAVDQVKTLSGMKNDMSGGVTVGFAEIFGSMSDDQLENVNLIDVFGVERAVLLSSDPEKSLSSLFLDGETFLISIVKEMSNALEYVATEAPADLNEEIFKGVDEVSSKLETAEVDFALLPSSVVASEFASLDEYSLVVIGLQHIPAIPSVPTASEPRVCLNWGNPLMWTASGSNWTADEVADLRSTATGIGSSMYQSVINAGVEPTNIVPQPGETGLDRIYSTGALEAGIQRYWAAVPSCNPL